MGGPHEGSFGHLPTGATNMIRLIHAIEPSSPLIPGFSRSSSASTTQPWSRYVVSCPGLDRARLGVAEFERQFQCRRTWCRDYCLDDFTIDIRLSGVEFSFVDEEDARQFRLTF
jgi:hypothetical protein